MVARAYSSAIRPIAVGRDLLRFVDELDQHVAIPICFVIHLHADDHDAFADVERHLVRELAEAVTQHAEQQGYQHAGPISVVLSVTENILKGTFSISNANPDAQPLAIETSTPSTQILATTPPTVSAALVLASGQRVTLDDDTLKVGRQATCRVALDDSNVSREHAQLRRGPDGWMILDLGSTNGTKINGTKISDEQLLVNGDEISFGTSLAWFEIS